MEFGLRHDLTFHHTPRTIVASSVSHHEVNQVDDLRKALTANRDEVERAVHGAEQELERCRARCKNLEELISRGRAVLGVESSSSSENSGNLTMHDAMVLVLRDHPDGLPAPDLLREIMERGLYSTRKGTPPGVGQIHARVGSYPHLFVREAGHIRLRRATDPK